MILLDLFYNPAAGSFRQARLDALVAAFSAQGFAVTTRQTTKDREPVTTAADIVCIHGGDGALRDVVDTLGEAAGRVPLCIAPSGTINLVARELGYAKSPEKLARQVAEGFARGEEGWVHSPLFRLGDTPIVSCMSIGADSHAVAQVSPALKRRIGRYAYAVALMRQLRSWPRAAMELRGTRADGSSFETQAEALIVARGALYGGPFRLSPRAELEADHFELVILRRPSRLGTLAVVLAAMLRLPLDRFGMTEIHSVRSVTFGSCVSPVQVDGDHMPDCAYAIAPSGMALRYVI